MRWRNDSSSLDVSGIYGQASPPIDTVETCSRLPRKRSDASSEVQSSIADQDDDAQLLHRIAARDRDAFECLYDRYAPRLMLFLTRYLGLSSLREEVVNEVMIIIWQRAADFRPTSRPSTWILGMARRKALEAYVRAVKVQARPGSALPLWRDEENLEEITLQEERIYIIGKALKQLPPDQRQTLTLAFYHNCSQQEIAARTGYPVLMIKSQMRKALRRIKVLLDRMQASQSLPTPSNFFSR